MYLINGKEVKKEDFNIPVENLAIWRGDGIFEAIAIHNGYLFAIDKHMERFAKSAEKMFFDDIDFTKIKEDLISIASKNSISKSSKFRRKYGSKPGIGRRS